MKEDYITMKERHQSEFNALPIKFAFSNEQFKQAYQELGVTDPKAELYAFSGGGFYRKSDAKLIHDTIRRSETEMDEAMKDEDFAVGAFEYEAGNHEFHINLDPHFDMGNCFGYPTKHVDGYGVIVWEQVPNGEFLRKCYDKGVKKFLAHARY